MQTNAKRLRDHFASTTLAVAVKCVYTANVQARGKLEILKNVRL